MDFMVMRVVAIALAVVVALIAVGTYAIFKPAPQASAPIESVALTAPTTATDVATTRRFEIQPGESQARFVIDEVLQGSPKTVVGSTNQVAGQIALDPTDLDTAQVGTILINARTIATDSEQRNRMIQNRILETSQHEYISFQPKQLVGLPDGAAAGQAVPIKIVGDLTIKGITHEVTFDATVTPTSADRLQGSAATTIRYADWGISIPRVPMVAGVADQAQLQLDFVATVATA
jgi:polyisoprenoid-binding protein YceI